MTKSIIIIATVLTLFSCDSRKSEETAADEKLQLIESLIAENKLNEAKNEIDSLHTQFPRLVNKRKTAVALKDTIILRESNRTLSYCNRILPELFKKVKALETDFTLKKDEKYEEIGKYTYKTQLTEQNSGKNYLISEVDENLDMYLTSNYSGSALNQFALKAEVDAGLSSQTDASNKNTGVFHSFTIESKNIEQLTFKNQNDGGIIKFIHENKEMDIKITLIGSKNFVYKLSSANKEAISKTYLFANALRLLKKTENDSRIAQQRIGKIKLLYNNN